MLLDVALFAHAHTAVIDIAEVVARSAARNPTVTNRSVVDSTVSIGRVRFGIAVLRGGGCKPTECKATDDACGDSSAVPGLGGVVKTNEGQRCDGCDEKLAHEREGESDCEVRASGDPERAKTTAAP